MLPKLAVPAGFHVSQSSINFLGCVAPQAACNTGKSHDVGLILVRCTGRQNNAAVDVSYDQLVIKLDIGLPDQTGGQCDLVFGAHTDFRHLATLIRSWILKLKVGIRTFSYRHY